MKCGLRCEPASCESKERLDTFGLRARLLEVRVRVAVVTETVLVVLLVILVVVVVLVIVVFW